MRKSFLCVCTAVLFLMTGIHQAQSEPLDLSTFSLEGNTSVDLITGIVTIDELDTSIGYSYFANDSFFVDADMETLTVEYSLSSTEYDFDWLVVKVDDDPADGVMALYDLEVSPPYPYDPTPVTGTYTLDLISYQNSNIGLAFGLEYDWADWAYGSVATFSDFEVIRSNGTAPVPEPATMILFGTGLAGVFAARRKKEL
ncbi:PEP-CTERM sorting domain-containing protein [Desulfopila sp. IMCC35008]|uniref:PEP-CTERM sorting domain-containing protein n=1 Tax=Desulfopila sp. IMCC35008 TaxID=2653858 RepID=UPI0013CF9A22|nr:PEP-CTERM sorting domain-containing protein [Desulfopila sp. IMCC35008]